MKKSSARYSEKAASPPTSSRQLLLSSHDIPLAQFWPNQLATRYTRECCVPKYTCWWKEGGRERNGEGGEKRRKRKGGKGCLPCWPLGTPESAVFQSIPVGGRREGGRETEKGERKGERGREERVVWYIGAPYRYLVQAVCKALYSSGKRKLVLLWEAQ